MVERAGEEGLALLYQDCGQDDWNWTSERTIDVYKENRGPIESYYIGIPHMGYHLASSFSIGSSLAITDSLNSSDVSVVARHERIV